MLAIKKHKRVYAVLLVNLLLLVTVFFIYRQTQEVISADNDERQLAKINLEVDSVLIALKDAQRGERGFLISGDKTNLETFYSAESKLNKIVGNLELLLINQKEIRDRFVLSKRFITTALAKFSKAIETREQLGAATEQLARIDYEGKLYLDTLQNKLMVIESFERSELNYEEEKSKNSLAGIVVLLITGGIVSGVLVLTLSVSLVRDLLKREELSYKLEGSEKRYHFLFELSTDGIVVADLDGKIVDCNSAACKIFGYSKTELLNQPYSIFFPPELRKSVPRKVGRDTVTGDKLIERTYVRKDGGIIIAEVYTKLIEANGVSNVVAHVRDITEKKHAQKAIAKSEAKYRNLFQRSLAGIFRTTVDGEIIECNDEYARILGYQTAGEIKNISTKTIYADPADRDKLVNLLRTEGEVKDLIMKLKKKDGTYAWVYDSVAIMHDDELDKDILFGTLVDITTQKETELLLVHSEKKYKDLVELLPQTVFEFDLTARVTFSNKAGFELFGYTQEEFEKGLNVFQMIIPEDREKAKKNIEAALKGIKQADNEYTAVRKDGTTFPILIYSSPLIKENKPVGIRGIVIDISDLKKAESKIRMLAHSLESISECVSITDARNIFLYVNESFTKTYGFTKEELVGKHISVVQPRSIVLPEIQKEILDSTNKGSWKGELINRRKDGSEFPVYLSTSIVRDSQNNPIALIGVATDITQQKQAEEVRKEREASLKEAQIIGKMGSWEYDFANRKNNWSENCFSLYNLKPYEIEPTFEYYRSKIHPDDLHLVDETYESVLRNGKQTELELRIIASDGSFKWIQTKIVPILENGRLMKVKGVDIDITERKQAEEEIYRLNRIYTVLSNINQTIVRVKDKKDLLSNACDIAVIDGKFKMSWIGLIDEQSGELKVAGSHGFVNGYLDEVILNKKKYPNNVRPISEIITTGKFLVFNDIEKLDTNVFWRQHALNRGYKSNAVFPLKVFGKVIGNYSLFSDQVGFFEEKEIRLLEEMSEDISFALETMEIEKKRKESESLFLTLANISPVGIFRTRQDGYTTYVNPKWCQLSNMTSDEAMGDGWLKAVHPDDRKWLSDGWQSATDKKRSSITEYRFLRADGSVAWVMGQAIPELNSEGQIEGYVGTITDITKIKLYEQELIKAKESAEKSDKIKSEFLAQMSHEIRTPINVMISSADYLKDELGGLIDHGLFSSFYAIDAAGKRIIRTVDLILNMAELQANNYQCTPEEINLSGQFLTSIYNEFVSFAKEKNLEFNFHRKVTDGVVNADEYSVKQIFTHLLDNAIKYTHKGKVELTLDREADGRVVVIIEDTGIGMSKEFMHVMYEPFTQEEQGYSRRFEGNGFGLALAKKYCDLNNAVISVQSEKEKGTTFTVSFIQKN